MIQTKIDTTYLALNYSLFNKLNSLAIIQNDDEWSDQSYLAFKNYPLNPAVRRLCLRISYACSLRLQT